MKSSKILVVGSSNTDMIVKSRNIPRPGETVIGGEFLMAPGGKGANQAVAAARLGGEVVFAAKVGDDLFGTEAIAGYEREGIDTSLILREKGCATGVALILVDGAGENLISVASGANLRWDENDIARLRPVIEAAGIVVMQLEIPVETVQQVAELADRLGVPVLLDPAPAAPLSEELLAQITYIKPNEHEAEQLTGIKISDEASALRAAARLFDKGVRKGVIITLGSQGALVQKRGGEPKFLSAPKIEAADTTAAGDAFTGGLACRLAQGQDLAESARFAIHVGSLSATRMGAQPSLPTRDEVAGFMENSA